MKKTEIGDSYTFTPSCLVCTESGVVMKAKFGESVRRVTGSVVYVNQQHGWFRVRYSLPRAGTQYECFPLPVQALPELITKHGYHGRYHGPKALVKN